MMDYSYSVGCVQNFTNVTLGALAGNPKELMNQINRLQLHLLTPVELTGIKLTIAVTELGLFGID